MVPSLGRSPTHGKPEKLLEEVRNLGAPAPLHHPNGCAVIASGSCASSVLIRSPPGSLSLSADPSDLAVTLALAALYKRILKTRDRLDVNASFT